MLLEDEESLAQLAEDERLEKNNRACVGDAVADSTSSAKVNISPPFSSEDCVVASLRFEEEYF